MRFARLRFEGPGALEDQLPELMDGVETLGCQLGDAADRTTASVFFQADRLDQAEVLKHRLVDSGATGVRLDLVEDQDWMMGFRNEIRAFKIGAKWWIDPHPEAPTPAPEGRTRLVIEPRMAFGSGTHESTRIVLEIMEDLNLKGCRVLDVGTGSGILSFAAMSCGAARVVAFDVDLDAVWVARESALQQIPSRSVELLAGQIDAIGSGVFDIALCNMIPTDFLPLLRDLRRCLLASAVVVLSGILVEQRPWVAETLVQSGFAVTGEHVLGEWIGLMAHVTGSGETPSTAAIGARDER